MAGRPARLAEIVKMSCKYIETGSLVFSPNGKAVEGVVGKRIASTLSKAERKSD